MKRMILLIGVIFKTALCHGQNTPIGGWEPFFNYKSGKHVISTGKRIFCASYNGLFGVNPLNGQIKSYSKVDGLAESGISSLAYHAESNTLVTAYRSGNIDLLELDEASELENVINISVLLEASNLPEKKQINQIVLHEGLGYLGTSFGIVVLDFLQQEVKETYRYIGPNGSEVNVQTLCFTADSLYALTQQGIIGTAIKSNVNRQYFANWKSIASDELPIAIFSNTTSLYAGIAGKGIYLRNGNQWKLIYNSVSQNYSFSFTGNKVVATLDKQVLLISDSGQVTVVTDPLFAQPKKSVLDGLGNLWVADSRNGLLGNPEKNFKTYNPVQGDTAIAPRTDSLISDSGGSIWSILPPYLGGGILVKDRISSKQRFLTVGMGQGGLPSYYINSLSLDKDGYVWFASNNGVGYFTVSDITTASRVDAILPIFGVRKLFANEPCNAIAVDSGNRKWIGATNGLYLFNSDGTELIEHFTAANSPLPSSMIKTLKFEDSTGLLFIDTPGGMVAYRTDASNASDNFSQVTIFPNPIRPGYTGVLGIKGLKSNCVVKITTLSGRLVHETRSQGGTASWNLMDYTGSRASGGIYLIMAISEDKSANFTGKFAIIDGNP